MINNEISSPLEEQIEMTAYDKLCFKLYMTLAENMYHII